MEEIFEAKEKSIMMRDENTIMHGELQVGESTIMFADSTNEFSQQNAGLFVYVANADDTYSKALEAGAVSIMDMCNQPYGRTGGVKDPFGNTWWITTDV